MAHSSRGLTYQWALTGVFAALHFVVSMLPAASAVGGTITWGWVSAPLIGFLLGPFWGIISVGIGSTLAMFAFPGMALMSVLTPLAPMAGAFTAGTIKMRRPLRVYLLFVGAIVMFLIGPIGTLASGFLWLHVVTLFLSLAFVLPRVSPKLNNGLSFSHETSTAATTLAVWLMGFTAVMADHLVGSTLFVYYMFYIGSYSSIVLAGWFLPITFIYPIERAIASVVFAVLGLVIGKSVAGAHFELPAWPAHTTDSETTTSDSYSLAGEHT